MHAGETIKVDQNRHVTVGGDDLIHVAGGRNDRVDGLLIVRGSAGVDVAGATVSLNGMANCKPAARVGDQVSSTAILTGSATVCIGG